MRGSSWLVLFHGIALRNIVGIFVVAFAVVSVIFDSYFSSEEELNRDLVEGDRDEEGLFERGVNLAKHGSEWRNAGKGCEVLRRG